MKLGQLIEYNKIIYFVKNYAEKRQGRVVSDLFLFNKKA